MTEIQAVQEIGILLRANLCTLLISIDLYCTSMFFTPASICKVALDEARLGTQYELQAMGDAKTDHFSELCWS